MLMALLGGCCIAGLAQMILGQGGKGVACLIGAVLLGIVTAGASALITWPLLAIDAYMVAKKLQRGDPVGKWDLFPQ